MCNKRSSVIAINETFRVDPCLRNQIAFYKISGIKTLACCCGHGRYPTTVVIKTTRGIEEMNTKIIIPRKKRFYLKDKDGFYYIPEISEEYKETLP
jgi:hypothetical protein